MWHACSAVLGAPPSRRAARLMLALAVLLPGANAGAQDDASPARRARPERRSEAYEDTIQITAQRVPESVLSTPAAVTVIDGAELARRGVRDLAGALAGVPGVSIGPGGDGGPASSVPEFMGLREFDAFLLVVDGVPWGGAFNPALSTVDLTDLDRIEVMRGAAPVMYGATSFVGVIHVLHRQAGAPGRAAELYGGSYGSGGGSFTTALRDLGGWHQSLAVRAERQGYKDDRTQFDRGHLLYRGAKTTANGGFRFDFDGTLLNQEPASPTPRAGAVLTPLVPLDSNQNPRDAKLDEERFHLVGAYDRTLGKGSWSTTLSYTHSTRDTLRGFLAALENTDPNAAGFRQDLSQNDVYFDSHVALDLSPDVRVVAGVDHLYGMARAESTTFDYFVPLTGGEPDVSAADEDMAFDLEDERNFSGLYGQVEWTPVPRLRVQVGARLNHTVEDREAEEEEIGGGEEPGEEEEGGTDKRDTTRGSGVVGVSWLAWEAGADGLWLYADVRDTFKPAALDFGPEAEPEILEPETATSYEIGAKGRMAGGRCVWDVSAFQMDFENLVLSQVRNGLPMLVNAGAERFRGIELETRVTLVENLVGQLAYSLHDARFEDFLREFDGVPRQLSGNKLEMSARHLGGLGLIWSPPRGLFGSVVANYTGERFLNARNTALAPDFTTLSAGLGYRTERWDLRLDGYNLTDERDPVAESELGDAQYYRQPARSVRLSWAARF